MKMRKTKKSPLGWGYVRRERLGGRWTTVVAPKAASEDITYEEGVERIKEVLRKAKNGNGD